MQASTSLTASEIAIINPPAKNIQTAVIGGTKTTGDVLTVRVYDDGLSTGFKDISYTVLPGDTIFSIAQGIAAAISANSDLVAINVFAIANDSVLFIFSASVNATTYKSQVSSGATETLTINANTSAHQYVLNNTNEIATITENGAVQYTTHATKALKSATINGNAAEIVRSKNFIGNVILNGGLNQVSVSATDGASTTKQIEYQQKNGNEVATTLTFDANGNMTSDGTKSYEWDASDRLIKIIYPGAQNFSSFVLDVSGRNMKTVEVSGGTTTIIKQFIWCGSDICEERNSGSSALNQFFSEGQTINGTNYYYTTDHLGSVVEMTDGSGVFKSRYSFDPFGRVTTIQESLSPDFQYAGYYIHSRSALNLTFFLAYHSSLSRWLSRDPLDEISKNEFTYINNKPTIGIDPLGLWPKGLLGKQKLCEEKLPCWLTKNFPKIKPKEAKKIAKSICDKLGWLDLQKGFGGMKKPKGYSWADLMKDIITYNNPIASPSDANAAADRLNRLVPDPRNLDSNQRSILDNFIKKLPADVASTMQQNLPPVTPQAPKP